MFGSLGAPELIIIGLIVVLLFGVGKISGLGRELGSSIKEFRKAVKDPAEEEAKAQQAAAQIAPPPAQPQPQYVQPPQQQYTPPQAPPQAAPQQSGDNKNIF